MRISSAGSAAGNTSEEDNSTLDDERSEKKFNRLSLTGGWKKSKDRSRSTSPNKDN